jgi:outer membrane protein TolC
MIGELRRDERAHAGAEAHPPVDALVRAATLDRRALIDAVLVANRDLEAARQAWRAAAAQVPAATALPDPTASYEFAPLSIGSSAVPYGQRIELHQQLPFPGKRALAGDAAVADAEAALADYGSARLELAERAAQLYDALYVDARALDINAENRALIEKAQHLAAARVASGRGTTHDALAAELELAHVEHDREMLLADQVQLVARLDGLLHRDPTAELPPPPAELAPPAMPGDVAGLERAAAAARPQAAGAAARVRGAEARVALAHRAYLPDFELMASYDSMWPMPQHRWMLGVGIDLPLARGRRDADVQAAEARAAEARATADGTGDAIRTDVVRTHSALVEALHVVHLYDERLLPAARAEVDAALGDFAAGQGDFAAVLDAARGLREIELGAARARADAWDQEAALDRALGRTGGES